MESGSDMGGSRSMKKRLDSSPSDRQPQGQHSGQPETSNFSRKWKEIEHPVTEGSLRLTEVN